MVSALSWAVLSLLYQTSSALPGVECKSGESYTVRQLNEGDSFIFKTYGKKYAPNQNCSTDVEMASCTEAVVNCQPFNVLGTKRCTRGDVLNVESLGSKTKKFCGKKGPKNLKMDANFTMNFISDNKGSKSGFKCLVSCTKEATNGPNRPVTQKDLDHLRDELDAQLKKVDRNISQLKTAVDSLDGRLNKTEPRALLCGYTTTERGISQSTVLTFDEVVDEISSGVSKGILNAGSGIFVAEVSGTYFITLSSNVIVDAAGGLIGVIITTSGSLQFFNVEKASPDSDRWQVATSRYVRIAAGDALYITLNPIQQSGNVIANVVLCVSLVDAE